MIEWIILSKDLFRDNTPIHECNIRSISEQFCYRGEMEHSKKKNHLCKSCFWVKSHTLSHSFLHIRSQLKGFLLLSFHSVR